MALVRTQILGRRAGARKGIVVLTLRVPKLLAAVNQHVFIAEQSYQVVSVTEAHAVASDQTGIHLMTVVKGVGTQTLADGDDVHGTPFNLKGAINTIVTSLPEPLLYSTQVMQGDRLGLKFTTSGDPATVLAGVVVTIALIPLVITGGSTGGDGGDRRYWLSEV